jgi:hypothetical protein
MKKTITLCLLACVFTSSNNAFGMLIKQTLCTKKYVRSVRYQKNGRTNQIKEILSDRLELDDWDRMYKGEEKLKDLYFRNNFIIDLLHREINDLVKDIKILEEQQDLAVQGLGYDDDKINKLEKKLHKSFKINNSKKPE